MKHRIGKNKFVFVRLTIMVVLSVFGLLSENETGVSMQMLLLVSIFIGLLSVKEFMSNGKKKLLVLSGFIIYLLMIHFGGMGFFLLGVFCIYEFMSLFPGINYLWYFAPLLLCLVDNPLGVFSSILIIFMMAALYVEYYYVIMDYEKRMQDDVKVEQSLKRNMMEQEYNAKAELKRNMLQAENQILEERSSLSQTLHDKLGHSINGSIYQLEGVKVLMDKDPDKARGMVQAVIDQLRTGMDEIRAILRRERPEKKELAMLQLYKLCEDCNSKGVEAELVTEGETAQIPDKLWEVILDNAFEAVSNSMKYARCKHIEIRIVVMNKMLRCSISDDGIGCEKIDDGMGISGMRQRIRAVNGSLVFETEAGFTVTMILPLEIS